jgi:phage N-6-adenine-methyltransferase
MNNPHFMSESNEWATPQKLFDEIAQEFGPFDLDAAATADNAKAPKFYTQQTDGLSQFWNGRVWCNPPYGRKIREWVKKAHDSIITGQAETVVLLIPARTDTSYWHDHVIAGASEIRYIRGRVKFVRPNGNGAVHSAPFPSAIVVFKRSNS